MRNLYLENGLKTQRNKMRKVKVKVPFESCVIILLVLGTAILVSGCLEQPRKVEPTYGHFLVVWKMGNEPERYVEITAEEFENFPLLKEAINKCASDRDNRCSLEGEYDGEYLRASEKQTFAILDFMLEKQEKKYSKRIIVNRMPCQTFCVNETEFNLEEFPTIKKAVGELGRIIEVLPNEWQSFRSLVERRFKENPFTTFGGVFIEVGNGYYFVEPYGLYADLNLKVRGEYYGVANIWLVQFLPYHRGYLHKGE